MEVRRVEGNDLVKNCVYNIYQKDLEDNYYNIGVYLVISENNRNNQDIRLKELNRGRYNLRIQKSEIYGNIPVVLTGFDLTGFDLTGADLTGADLTGADLTGAVLTGAVLTGANLANATIYSNQLSEEQRRQIIGQPNYIGQPRQQRQEQQYFNINKE